MSGIESIVFDIETGPLPDDQLKAIMPEFECSDSRLKDPAKIEENIERQKRNWFEKAALSATTGRVLAIGALGSAGALTVLHGQDEKVILGAWWELYESTLDKSAREGGIVKFVGHNIKGFDLPFMVRRSWINGIVPSDVLKGRYWQEHFVDTTEVWQMGSRTSEAGSCSLDSLARALGVGRKNGSGADFAELYAKDVKAALAYLENDLRITWDVARRMGVVHAPAHAAAQSKAKATTAVSKVDEPEPEF